MLFAVAAILTTLGAIACYVAVGLARTTERSRCYVECEKRLSLLRRQLMRGRA